MQKQYDFKFHAFGCIPGCYLSIMFISSNNWGDSAIGSKILELANLLRLSYQLDK